MLFRMSHFPCIRPSLLNKKWIIQETKLNRIEIVRRKEEALLQKFKLISKQGNWSPSMDIEITSALAKDGARDVIVLWRTLVTFQGYIFLLGSAKDFKSSVKIFKGSPEESSNQNFWSSILCVLIKSSWLLISTVALERRDSPPLTLSNVATLDRLEID